MTTREQVAAQSPLLELFREEILTACATMQDGLSSQAIGSDSGVLDPLIRAAHSIRGAARVVQLEAVATLAGVMEDTLSTAKAQAQPMSTDARETLRKATDLLAQVGAAIDAEKGNWLEPMQRPLEQATDDIRQLTAPRQAAPVAPPTPVPAAPVSPSLAGIDQPLLDLFREEVHSHAQALTTGLVELEKFPGDPTRIEPLMRAAHSIKGAARVVQVDPAVQVAHLAEDCLVAAQQGKLALTPSAIDLLLASTDLLAEMGEATRHDLTKWFAQHVTRYDQLLLQLQGLLTGAPPVEPAKVASPAPAPEPLSAEIVPIAPQPAPVVVATPAPPPPALAADSGGRNPEERVVRVTAISLSRLMGLAGESLVEARWLQPFAGSLLKLKKQQDRLTEVLDELRQSPEVLNGSQELLDRVEEARLQLRECTAGLTERIGEFESHSRLSDDLNSRLYREVIASRMRPFADGTQGFPRMVRDLSRTLGKQVDFEILGQTTDVDRDILEKLEAPLNHILRNALDHGLETPEVRRAANKSPTGRLRLEARHNAGMLQIKVEDDGRGIELEKLRRKVVERGLTTAEMSQRLTESELLEFLFLPGFSTAEKVTEVSGRGVGLDVVHSMVQTVGGTVRIRTRAGTGTTFLLQLPITLSVIRAVLVEVAGETFAFPLNRIDRLLRMPRKELRSIEGRQYITVDETNIGIVLGRQIFDIKQEEPAEGDLLLVLFSGFSGEYGLVVDDFRGEQDLVVRPLDGRLGKVPNISAAALLDDGSPVLIADVEDLTRSIEELLRGGTLRRTNRRQLDKLPDRKRLLVVDDSITVREVQRQLLSNRGYLVDVAVDGLDGLEAARNQHFDLIISDIDMPRMNGLEFVRSLKSDSRLQPIPVIIVSYKDREEDRLRGLQVGANYYLTKSSFHDDRLLNAVEELIGDP